MKALGGGLRALKGAWFTAVGVVFGAPGIFNPNVMLRPSTNGLQCLSPGSGHGEFHPE